MADVVRWEKRDTIAHVWLSNPEKRNAMGHAFFEQLPAVMAEVAADDSVRAVVLAAEGPAFTVGLDLKAMQGLLQPEGGQIAIRKRLHADVLRLQAALASVADAAVPTIGVLHGYCIGGGVDLACCCDLRIAAADLKLSVRETKVGIVADLGTLQRLPRIIPKGHVAELCFSGKDIDAERAARIGFVNDVYPTREATLEAAEGLAREIAANSPLVVQGVKRVLRFSEDKPLATGLEYVAAWNSAFLLSEDLTEAMVAFLSKRPPQFTGN